jgi:hypothetical protein
MKYTILIEEHVSQYFEIEADSENEALEIAEKKYQSCELVLEPGYLLEKRCKWV